VPHLNPRSRPLATQAQSAQAPQQDAKGKLCGGHLKRWYYVDDIMEREHDGDVEKAFGRDAEIYRCEHCKTLYLPSPVDPQGTNVAGEGQISTPGLTLPPKA